MSICVHGDRPRRSQVAIRAAAAAVAAVLAVASAAHEARADVDRRCRPVDVRLRDRIDARLAIGDLGSLRGGWTVRSRDFRNVSFVSLQIDAPGQDVDGAIGTWATTRRPGARPSISAVDATAREVSAESIGSGTRLSMRDDGAATSRSCTAEDPDAIDGA